MKNRKRKGGGQKGTHFENTPQSIKIHTKKYITLEKKKEREKKRENYNEVIYLFLYLTFTHTHASKFFFVSFINNPKTIQNTKKYN